MIQAEKQGGFYWRGASIRENTTGVVIIVGNYDNHTEISAKISNVLNKYEKSQAKIAILQKSENSMWVATVNL